MKQISWFLKIYWKSNFVRIFHQNKFADFQALFFTPGHVDWKMLVEKRDAYVKRLNGIYATNLENSKVTHIHGMAKFISSNKVLSDNF